MTDCVFCFVARNYINGMFWWERVVSEVTGTLGLLVEDLSFGSSANSSAVGLYEQSCKQIIGLMFAYKENISK